MGTKLNASIIELEQLTDIELLFVEAAIETALRRVRNMRECELTEIASPTMLMSRLTPREKDVLPLLVAGYSSKEIGIRLHISDRTVEVHREHIMGKLAVSNTIDLVNMLNALG